MTTPLKIVQVGLGGWGWSWVSVVQESPHWELVGIVDLNEQLLADACKTYGIDASMAFTSLRDAAAKVQADAVLVIVPPEHHAAVAIEAFEYGWHAIIEKPLAASVDDALKIVTAAEKNGCKVMVSQNYRFKRAPQTVKRVVQQKLVGELGSVFINFQKNPPFTGFRLKMDEPLIYDMAVHHFDQIRGILGLEPVTVMATSWNPAWSRFDGNAVANVIFETEQNVVVTYTGSWVSRGWETTWDGDWRIQGDDGEIHWANNQVTVRPINLFKTVFMKGAVESEGKLHVDLVEMAEEERWASLAEFAQAIREGREPETSGRDNLKSLAMVLGAVESAKTGQKIHIRDLLQL